MWPMAGAHAVRRSRTRRRSGFAGQRRAAALQTPARGKIASLRIAGLPLSAAGCKPAFAPRTCSPQQRGQATDVRPSDGHAASQSAAGCKRWKPAVRTSAFPPSRRARASRRSKRRRKRRFGATAAGRSAWQGMGAGVANASHLCHAFKKVYGRPPQTFAPLCPRPPDVGWRQ